MPGRDRRGGPRRRGEQGFAGLMFVALVGTALILLALSFAETLPGTGVRRTAAQDLDLRRAREAVVAFYLSHDGAWPCPDTNDDGIADNSDSQCSAAGELSGFSVGTVPWVTLSVARREVFDLRGQPLLYAADPAAAIDLNLRGATQTVAYVLAARGRDGAFSTENGDGDTDFEMLVGGGFDDRLSWQE